MGRGAGGFRWAFVAVAAMVVVDVLLVGWALKRQSDPPPRSTIVRTSTSSEPTDEPSSEPTGGSSPSAEPSEASTSGTPDASAAVLLSASGDVVLRATRGSCDQGGGEVQRSTDGGKTFAPVTLKPEPAEIDKIDAQTLVVVGSDEQCGSTTYDSADGGGTWQVARGKAEWHLDPDPAASQVVSPNGPMSTPCPPVSLSIVRDDIVRLLCSDGRIFRTPDDRRWSKVGSVPGATAIRFPSPYQGFALAPEGSCETAALESEDAGATWKRRGCLDGGPGVALASSADGGLLAVAGDRLQVSRDSGVTWRAP